MKTIGLIFLISFLLSFSGTVHAQDMTLEECDTRFREHLEGLKNRHREQMEELHQNYLAALMRFETESRSAGNLQDVQAARKEIEQTELDEDGRNVFPSDNARIQHMQDIRSRQLKDFARERAEGVVNLVNAVKTFAENTSRELTRNNQIEEAVKWTDWLNKLESEPDMAVAMRTLEQQRPQNPRQNPKPGNTAKIHAALSGRPVTPIQSRSMEYPNGPKAYIAGNEPEGNEKRMGNVSTPSAQGLGSGVLMAVVKLVDEDASVDSYRSRWSNYKKKAHIYIPRLEFSPMVGKPMGRSLVVFDLFKRGTGSKRELIHTDQVLLPPLDSETKIVVDAGPYEYETEKYRSAYSSYSYDRATADKFYGYIVTIFDETGELIFQRTTERALNEYARETLPR